MTNEQRIIEIAEEVRTECVRRDSQSRVVEDIYVAVGCHLALASYSGRKNEYSVKRFRENMVIVSALCQMAAEANTEAIRQERLRQNKLWGIGFDKKNTANDWPAYILHYISKAYHEPQDYVENMLKAACLAQAAILIVDIQGHPAPRHYEELPGAGAHCEHCGGQEGPNHICGGAAKPE